MTSTETKPILKLQDVSKRYGGVVALNDVSFDLQAGEVHGLIGENGAGKSTMMKLLSGAVTEYSGQMWLAEEAVHFSSPAEAQAKGIGMVYQELSAFEHISVAENIFGRNLPRRHGLVDWKRMNREAQAHLEELGLDIKVTMRMGRLPIGNQQIVEIARVIFSGAKIIILDEPTSALSPPEIQRLFNFVRTLKEQGRSVIFISHFLEDVLEIADRITVLKDGQKVATLLTEETNKPELVTLMIGDEAQFLQKTYVEESHLIDEVHDQGPMMVSVQNLAKRGAFHDVSFQVHSGEILGLFGFMGAGQVQLAHCLFGSERFDTGSISLDGRNLKLKNTTQAAKAGIAFVPENRRHSIMPKQEIYKNITLAHLGDLIRGVLRQKEELQIALAQMQNLGVHPLKPKLPVAALSGGNQQKVVLAKWLTRQPRFLILNEPTRGIDVGAKEEVRKIIKDLRDMGTAILLISTEPEMILSFADRSLVMRKGQVTAVLSGPELTKENLMQHA